MRRLTITEFVKRAKAIFGDKYDYSLVDYKNTKKKVIIICPKHGKFLQRPLAHLKGHGCRKCFDDKLGNERRYTTEKFVSRAREIHGPIYDYSKVVYLKSNSKVDIICPKHGIFSQLPASHLAGRGCPKCAPDLKSQKTMRSQEDFIKAAKEVHGEKYNYSKVKYRGSLNRVEIICFKHGSFFQSPKNHIQGCGCPNCNNSHGEDCVQRFLDKFHFAYEKQKKLPDMKYKLPLAFDFFLPEQNVAMEFNGEQHYYAIKAWGGIDALRVRQQRDQIKRDYCSTHGIKLLEIRYEKNIEKDLTKHLLQ